MTKRDFFAVCPVYLEELLAAELQKLGASELRTAHGGVRFSAGLTDAYRICLWSRIANRILMPVASFNAGTTSDITENTAAVDWEEYFSGSCSISVDAVLSKTKLCTPDYAALCVKDGIVDRQRSRTGTRAVVETKNPDVRIYLFISVSSAEISIDLSGEGLHRRGYRVQTVPAALRENTAAAVLMRAGWPIEDAAFLDPMCGSGTLLIEAVRMSAGIAPGLGHSAFGFERLLFHDEKAWKKLKDEALALEQAGLEGLARKAAGQPLFFAADRDSRAVSAAKANMEAAGLGRLIGDGTAEIRQQNFLLSEPGRIKADKGLIAVNPPYGERIGKGEDLPALYSDMGKVFRKCFPGWKASVITEDKTLAAAVGMKPTKTNTIVNGGIRCILSHYEIFAAREGAAAAEEGPAFPSPEELSPGSMMMYNRLKKNRKKLSKWLKNTGVTCYRLYDADMPEYAVAVDIYPPYAVIQEYAPPKTIPAADAASRFREAVRAVRAFLELPKESVILKKRQKQKGSSQYVKKNETAGYKTANRFIIGEHGHKFYADMESYLDTGIFLDSRPIRRLIEQKAAGRDFLNLFCYTATASVYAAAGGAVSTTSVDASRTYLDWAESNFRLNKMDSTAHRCVREDCLAWLKRSLGLYGLIFIDPPTFSNSKDRSEIFDVQKDHGRLINMAADRLAPGGEIIFCCNFRGFKLDEDLETRFETEEISAATIDPDFERNSRIHRCWLIKPRGGV